MFLDKTSGKAERSERTDGAARVKRCLHLLYRVATEEDFMSKEWPILLPSANFGGASAFLGEMQREAAVFFLT
jgi:hypothetical protein